MQRGDNYNQLWRCDRAPLRLERTLFSLQRSPVVRTLMGAVIPVRDSCQFQWGCLESPKPSLETGPSDYRLSGQEVEREQGMRGQSHQTGSHCVIPGGLELWSENCLCLLSACVKGVPCGPPKHYKKKKSLLEQPTANSLLMKFRIRNLWYKKAA